MFILFHTFHIEKTMFEDQVHERYQFSLDYEGKNYKGIYFNEEITWFHPLPFNNIKKEVLTNIEEEVHKRMQDQLFMFHDFHIEKTMFEGQVHERQQFLLNYAENTYKGIYHNGEITWFHPHPLNNLEGEHLSNVEVEVYKRMQV